MAGARLVALTATAACDFPVIDAEIYGKTATTEGGDTVEITIALAHEPEGIVTVYAVGSDDSEGRVSQPLVFDRGNWQEVRTISVEGVDDTLDDGDVQYDVSVHAKLSWRPRDPDRLLKTFRLTNMDDDGASFEGLGDLAGGESESYVSDVSASGDVVVGWSSGRRGEEAVRWTPQHGLQALGGPDSRAQAVSSDGKLIVGSLAEPGYQGGRAGAIWRGAAPPEVLVGPMHPQSGQILFWVVEATVVLDDGRIFGTCIEYGAYGDPLACRFDRAGAVTIYHSGHVFAADDQGNFAGTLLSERHAPLHSQATYNARALPYSGSADCTEPSTGCFAEARDFSTDGREIVGTSRLPVLGVSSASAPSLVDTAFLYTAAASARSLSNLDDVFAETGAYAVSRDGRVIAGFGMDAQGQQAVVWVNGVPATLRDILHRAGGSLSDGWQLFDVRAMSSDARTFVGNGRNPDGKPEGFRIVLPVGL